MSYLSHNSMWKVYVDACVLSNGSMGVGIYCPDYPALNAGEPCPKSLKSDVNLGEMYAIIRGMEKASKYNLSKLTIISDSSAAIAVAQSSEWPDHYKVLWTKFKSAHSALRYAGCAVDFRRPQGDAEYHNHSKADEYARKGAENCQ